MTILEKQAYMTYQTLWSNVALSRPWNNQRRPRRHWRRSPLSQRSRRPEKCTGTTE